MENNRSRAKSEFRARIPHREGQKPKKAILKGPNIRIWWGNGSQAPEEVLMSPTIDPEHPQSQPRSKGDYIHPFSDHFCFSIPIGICQEAWTNAPTLEKYNGGSIGVPWGFIRGLPLLYSAPIAESLHRTWLWQQPGFIAIGLLAVARIYCIDTTALAGACTRVWWQPDYKRPSSSNAIMQHQYETSTLTGAI